MSQIVHSTALASVTTATPTAGVRVDAAKHVAILCVNGITTSVIFTVEGSLDGTNWFTMATSVGSDAAPVKTAITVLGSAKQQLYLPPNDMVNYVRVNVSTPNANGTAFTVYSDTTP